MDNYPEREASLPVTHEDAYHLARMKYNESNLARCYLALREALAQREAQEPVATGDAVRSPHGIGEVFKREGLFGGYWLVRHTDGMERWYDACNLKKLYTSPPPAQVPSEWVEAVTFAEEIFGKMENGLIFSQRQALGKLRALLAKQEGK